MKTIFPPGVLAAALLLSACAGTGVNQVNGPGGALPTEERLSAGAAAADAGRAAAAWSLLGTGPHSRVDQWRRNGISASMIADAAGTTPRDGEAERWYQCADDPCGRFSRRDASRLWWEESWHNSNSQYIKIRRPEATLPDTTGYGVGFGITQSARGGAITDDSIAVALGHDSDGDVTYKVGYTHAPDRGALERWTFDSTTTNAVFESISSAGATAATVSQTVGEWSTADSKGVLFSARPAGASDVWLAVSTDITGSSDTDWLATGLWALTPSSGAAGGYQFGVFADGGDPYSVWNINRNPPTGTATYNGDASGIFHRRPRGYNWDTYQYFYYDFRMGTFFNADVTLTANFDQKRLSGTIDNFTDPNGWAIRSRTYRQPTLTLEAANWGWITASGAAHITGDTSMTWDTDTWSGKWGARFYGNPTTSTARKPGSVAGTFGVTTGSGDSSRTFIGAFGAHR